jgi:hypothetical protein
MEWGNSGEKDLFVVRFVLMKLAVNRVKDAEFIIEHYKSTIDTPLMHFGGMVEIFIKYNILSATCESCENKKSKGFGNIAR